jgi:hypothetical protein
MTTPEQVDLAASLMLLSTKLTGLATLCRGHAHGLIMCWANADNAESLAEILEETARLVRLNAPNEAIDSPSH